MTAGSAVAIPNLQLDISGGGYDTTTDTIVARSNVFTLYALLEASCRTSLNETYYISAALTPKTRTTAQAGSFSFNGQTVHATTDMVYGVPPLESNLSFDAGDLSKHDVYETYFTEFSFMFDPTLKTAAYNTERRAMSGAAMPTSGSGVYLQAFAVDLSSLADGYGIHFDLYTESARSKRCITDIDVDEFAPFSHDAEGTRQEPAPVPEPGTMMLLGAGFLGLAIYGKRRKNS